MNIRRVIRLGCLTIASFFWASCGDESNSQAPVPEPEIPDPDSSSGENGAVDVESSSSAEIPESSGAVESSSAEIPEEQYSSEASGSSSSNAESSSSHGGFVLAVDPSVTCEYKLYQVSASCGSTESLSCEDYKKYLASDTTLSEKLLTAWEEKLQSCGAVLEPITLYGIGYSTCLGYTFTSEMECSNGLSYRDYKIDGTLVYRNTEEYNELKGISSAAEESSSSVAESSSSAPEDLVKNCPHEDFALFADILADVQKEMYRLIVGGDIYALLDVETWFNDASKEYIESLLDHEKKSLKGNFSPYMTDYDYDVLNTVVWESNVWFDGYIAKTKTCEDGTPVETDRYKEAYTEILNECFNIVFDNAKIAGSH